MLVNVLNEKELMDVNGGLFFDESLKIGDTVIDMVGVVGVIVEYRAGSNVYVIEVKDISFAKNNRVEIGDLKLEHPQYLTKIHKEFLD